MITFLATPLQQNIAISVQNIIAKQSHVNIVRFPEFLSQRKSLHP
jgi:hypothetical protein